MAGRIARSIFKDRLVKLLLVLISDISVDQLLQVNWPTEPAEAINVAKVSKINKKTSSSKCDAAIFNVKNFGYGKENVYIFTLQVSVYLF